MKVVFLYELNNITTNYSMIPFYLWAKNNKNVETSFFHQFEINKKFYGDLLIIIRRYEVDNLSKEILEKEINYFYKRFKKIIYFDDSAALSKINWNIVNMIDLYCKRGLLKDREQYKRKLYGGRIYSDFYHNEFNICDKKEANSSVDISNKYDWDKVDIAWNIGIGIYFLKGNYVQNNLNNFLKKGSRIYSQFFNSNINKFISSRYIDFMINNLSESVRGFKHKGIMGRISSEGYLETVGYQRKKIKEKLEERQINTEKISFHKYLKESDNFSAFISPFGWGEICFRDFESILLGKVLIKPNCDHIDTWPNIYKNNMYLPINWKLDNFEEVIQKSLEKEAIETVNIARLNYKSALQQINQRVDKIIKKVLY